MSIQEKVWYTLFYSHGMNVPCVERTGDSVFHERALAASSSSRDGSCLAPKLIGLGRYGLEKNRGMNTHLVDDDIFRKFGS
jgi:hypothetical protein